MCALVASFVQLFGLAPNASVLFFRLQFSTPLTAASVPSSPQAPHRVLGHKHGLPHISFSFSAHRAGVPCIYASAREKALRPLHKFPACCRPIFGAFSKFTHSHIHNHDTHVSALERGWCQPVSAIGAVGDQQRWAYDTRGLSSLCVHVLSRVSCTCECFCSGKSRRLVIFCVMPAVTVAVYAECFNIRVGRHSRCSLHLLYTTLGASLLYMLVIINRALTLTHTHTPSLPHSHPHSCTFPHTTMGMGFSLHDPAHSLVLPPTSPHSPTRARTLPCHATQQSTC